MNQYGMATSMPLVVFLEEPEPRLRPIAVGGWNADLILESGPSATAQPFDSGTACWFGSGLGGAGDGLPASRRFVSLADSGATYELCPFDRPNVLLLRRRQGFQDAGFLEFTQPARMKRIGILTASANGNSALEAMVELVDGTRSRPIRVATFDWWSGSSPPAAAIAASGLSRSKETRVFNRDPLPPGFNLYESIIDLEAQGLSHQPVRALHFKLNATGVSVGVFALSGLPVSAEEGHLNLIWDSNGISIDMFLPTGRTGSLESSMDLLKWTESLSSVGRGLDTPIRVTLAPDSSTTVQFWRVRVP
jgi:hypothetical protein